MADNQLNTSAYGAAAAKRSAVVVCEKGGCADFVLGACADAAGTVRLAMVSTLQQKSCRIGSSSQKSKRDY